MFDTDEEAGSSQRLVLGPFSPTHHRASSADRGGEPRPWTARAPPRPAGRPPKPGCPSVSRSPRPSPQTDDGCHDRTNPRRTSHGWNKTPCTSSGRYCADFRTAPPGPPDVPGHRPSVDAHAHEPAGYGDITERRAITTPPSGLLLFSFIALHTARHEDGRWRRRPVPARLATASTARFPCALCRSTAPATIVLSFHACGTRPSSPPVNKPRVNVGEEDRLPVGGDGLRRAATAGGSRPVEVRATRASNAPAA